MLSAIGWVFFMLAVVKGIKPRDTSSFELPTHALGQLRNVDTSQDFACARAGRHTVDADKHPVAAPTVLISATDGPVTSSTTNSGGTRHLNGTPLVPMPLVT